MVLSLEFHHFCHWLISFSHGKGILDTVLVHNRINTASGFAAYHSDNDTNLMTFLIVFVWVV